MHEDTTHCLFSNSSYLNTTFLKLEIAQKRDGNYYQMVGSVDDITHVCIVANDLLRGCLFKGTVSPD
jgi:hypothetical protein